MRRVRLWLIALLGLAAGGRGMRAQQPDNPHGPNIGACSMCHRASAWKPVVISRDFHHAPQTFPLEGAHAKAACTACHRTLDFAHTSTACASCHTDVHHGEFGTACARCHTPRSFVDPAEMRRMHDLTRFPLRGAHTMAACESCHVPASPGQSQYANRPTTCFGCHFPDYRQAKDPDHVAGAYPQVCSECHSEVSWQGATFDHNATGFPLTGGHLAVSCNACHGDGVYKGKSTLCVSCHQTDFNNASNPPHAASGFPTTCETCHSTTNWTSATFNHSATNFPLTGGHLAVSCNACHGDGVYKGKSTLCVSCHQTDFNSTSSPAHAAAGFPTTCETCHSTTNWTSATFNHSTTNFPLTGAHVSLACNACHGDGVFKGKPTTCVSCHQTDFNSTSSPAHAAAGFPTTCETCHSTTNWTSATFNHSTTNFPLTGAHLAVACNACHGDGVYKGKSTLCVSCHQTDFNSTSNPAHAAAGFPTTCETCHSTTNWTSATFNHSTTNFPLTGAHVSLACNACHGDGVFKGKPTTCVSCHLADYSATNNPIHSAAGFPQTCEQCHTTSTWSGATFNHDGSFFPIYSGSHQGRWSVCADCHTSVSNYAVFTCMSGSCHGKSSTDSNHSGVSGYRYDATACYACHPRGNGG